MSKLHKLKEWYSIEDAAKRLSVTFSELITAKDLIQLAVEGHISLSWYIRHVAASEVKFGRKKINLSLLDSDEVQDCIVEKFFWAGNDYVDILDGPHHILLDHCKALSDYLLAQITNTGGELISLDGYYVTNGQGKFWNIVEVFDEDSIEGDGYERNLKIYHSSKYYPSGKWPEMSELGFTRGDIENFESSLFENTNVHNEMKTKEREAYLNIIGALLGLLLGKSSNDIPYSQFRSQQAIIDAIHANFGKGHGLSQRNLEDKFSKAKEKLKSSE